MWGGRATVRGGGGGDDGGYDGIPRWWGWVSYVAGGVALDSFFFWVGYLCVRETSRQGLVAGRSYHS